MATLLDSKEKEVILLPDPPFDIKKEKLLGIDHPAVEPSNFLDDYVKGRNTIHKIYSRNWKKGTGQHDMVHSAMVLFLAYKIIQTGKLKLSQKEREQLSTAIVYHDIGQSNDRSEILISFHQ